jgi:hypothetical protein
VNGFQRHRLDGPVLWYARCVAFRECDSHDPTKAPTYGKWQRSDYWAADNLLPQSDDRLQSVFPKFGSFPAPGLDTTSTTQEPECFLFEVKTEADGVGAEPPHANIGLSSVFSTLGAALSADTARAAATSIRTLVERGGIDGLCWTRSEFFRSDRVARRSAGQARPIAAPPTIEDNARTHDYDVRDPLVDTAKPVWWYLLAVEARSVRFDILRMKAAPGWSLRFSKYGPWKSQSWVAKENAEPIADPANIPLVKPKSSK